MKQYNFLFLVAFFLQGCAELGFGTTPHNAWVQVDNGIIDPFRYEAPSLSKEHIEKIKASLSIVYDGKKCIGQDNKEKDVNYCKSVDLIVSNADKFFQEWSELNISEVKLEENEERFPEELNTEKILERGEQLKSIQQKLKNFISKYGLSQFKNDDTSEMSGLAFYVEKKLLGQNIEGEIVRMNKVIAQVKKMDNRMKVNEERCATFEKAVTSNTDEQLKLQNQVVTAQDNSTAQTQTDHLKKLSEKLRFMIFDRKNKGCRSYKGMD